MPQTQCVWSCKFWISLFVLITSYMDSNTVYTNENLNSFWDIRFDILVWMHWSDSCLVAPHKIRYGISLCDKKKSCVRCACIRLCKFSISGVLFRGKCTLHEVQPTRHSYFPCFWGATCILVYSLFLLRCSVSLNRTCTHLLGFTCHKTGAYAPTTLNAPLVKFNGKRCFNFPTTTPVVVVVRLFQKLCIVHDMHSDWICICSNDDVHHNPPPATVIVVTNSAINKPNNESLFIHSRKSVDSSFPDKFDSACVSKTARS